MARITTYNGTPGTCQGCGDTTTRIISPGPTPHDDMHVCPRCNAYNLRNTIRRILRRILFGT